MDGEWWEASIDVFSSSADWLHAVVDAEREAVPSAGSVGFHEAHADELGRLDGVRRDLVRRGQQWQETRWTTQERYLQVLAFTDLAIDSVAAACRAQLAGSSLSDPPEAVRSDSRVQAASELVLNLAKKYTQADLAGDWGAFACGDRRIDRMDGEALAAAAAEFDMFADARSGDR